MEREMTHDELRDALPAAALDALLPLEQARVEAHAAGCAECARELAELREGVGALAFAAPAAGAADRVALGAVRTRLLARAAADGAARRDSPSAPGSFPVRAMKERSGAHPVIGASGRREGWLALAAGILLATSIGLGTLWSRERAARGRETTRLAEQVQSLEGRAEVAEREADELHEVVDALSGPQVSIVTMTAAGARDPKARMFWDRASNTWTMLAQDLAAPGRGRTYQLWLVTTDGQRINAGTFDPDASGRAVVRATYELEPTRLAAVAVTDEPEGGSPQPTTEPFLVGTGR